MNVLIIGSGGREHALGYIISKSKLLDNLYFTPGNYGTSLIGTNIDYFKNNREELYNTAKKLGIDFVIVGPELEIVGGIADYLETKGIKTFAPSAKSAFLESSKIEARNFMKRNGVPIPEYSTFNSFDAAYAHLKNMQVYPMVIKADGLAAGKGVAIVSDIESAESVLRDYIEKEKFGKASKRVVIEEFLEGYEYSVFAVVNGEKFFVFGDAVDYKRAYDDDKGPNTGGMGSISPAPFLNKHIRNETIEKVIEPTVRGLGREAIHYRGFIYFGLIWTKRGPYVLEYNVRMGDPETQSIVMNIEYDFLEMLLNAHSGKIDYGKWQQASSYAVTVILASRGYPLQYDTGKPVKGLSEVRDSQIFHAGTKLLNGRVVTSGGRVLGVTAKAPALGKARSIAYKDVARIDFGNKFFRYDIGDMKRWKDIL